MKNKIVILIIAVVTVIAVSISTVYAVKLSESSGKNTNKSTSSTVSIAESKKTTTVSTTEPQTKAKKTTTAKQIVQSKKKTTTKATAKVTEIATNNVVKGTKSSKILKGYKAAKSWKVSSAQSSAYIEKIALTLDVYGDNSTKTGKNVKRYGYFAIVNTSKNGTHMVTAKSTTGKLVDTAVNISKSYGALVAVNNEMCNHNLKTYKGFLNAANDQPSSTVIKEKKIAQSGESTPSLLCYADGTWEYPVWVSPENAQSLIFSGVVNSVGYTYPLIWKGEKYKLPDTGDISPIWYDHCLTESNPKQKYYNDHTVVGQIDADTYVFAVSDGFGQAYLAEFMFNNLGVQNAYWCNGGHCALMYVKGYGAVNRPNDRNLCLTADIFCVK